MLRTACECLVGLAGGIICGAFIRVNGINSCGGLQTGRIVDLRKGFGRNLGYFTPSKL